MEAIRLCCDIKNRIAGVTGQAGTGKTTIMKQVHAAFEDAGHDVALCAPTGKAAKRIGEATGIDATTIHRLLEFTHPGDPDPKTGKVYGISMPRRNEFNPLNQSVVLVDEASMINKPLWRQLINALPRGGLVRLFGDVNQLPPIEEDNNDTSPSPFMDALKNFPSVTLKNIYRQGEGSGIVKNAHRILNGMMPMPSDDFKILWTGELQPNDPVTKMLTLARDSGIDFRSINNQIVTPINRTWIGQLELNQKLQELLMPNAMRDGFPMPRHRWDKHMIMVSPGDKVIWKKNNYDLEIYNGETGNVEDIVNDIININFGDRTVGVPPWIEYMTPDGDTKGYDPRQDLYLAYALTTHATQGSEYTNVVPILGNSAYSMLYRNNLYTACTRASKMVHLITDQRSLQRAVVNKNPWMPSKKKKES